VRKVFAKLSFAFIIIPLTVVINMGCSLSVLEQRQKTFAPEKPQESIFTVVNTTDVKKPTIVSSIRLPFRVSQNNTIVLSDKHAYITTKHHLHVIDVSNLQQPSYMTSIIFPDEIGKARVSKHQVFVASRQKICLVDVSKLSNPVIQSVVSLHHSNVIREFDIHESFLYVLDINAYFHIYSIIDGNAQFVETVEIKSPSSLVGVRAKGAAVEQILLEHRTSTDPGWEQLSNRTDLLEISGRYEKVRISKDYLIYASHRYPNRDITIVWGKNQYRPNMWEWLEHYNIGVNYLEHLYLTGKKKLARGKPTEAYIEHSNRIQFIAQDQWSETIDFKDNHLLGPITDLQISRKLLYVANAKGVLSIIHLDAQERHRFISATTLQDQHPISIAVDEDYVYISAAPEDSQR